MKKCLSIFCVMALLLCSFIIPASAASVTIALDSQTAKVGDEVTFTATLSGNADPGITSIQYNVSYDTTKFTFVKATKPTDRALKGLSFTPPRALNAGVLKFTHYNSDLESDATNGVTATFVLKVNDGVADGSYPITVEAKKCTYTNPETAEDTKIDITAVSGTLTVESAATPVAKTVSYTVANGTVMASTVALAAPAEAKASGTITTAGTAPEEEVYFYFFPNKGYTTDGMTVNGAEVIGAAASKKYTVTADATYDFVFKKIEDAAAITAKPTGAISGTPAAASLTTFATAAGASEFGILIGAADAWGTDITADYAAASETGKIRKYAALEANGEGQFAIELNDTAKNFLKNGTYRAYIYAANGSIVTFGDAIDIAIAE